MFLSSTQGTTQGSWPGDLPLNITNDTSSSIFSSTTITAIVDLSWSSKDYLTKDERRALMKADNRETFWTFLQERYAAKSQRQCKKLAVLILKWETGNHLRPVPMLC